MRSVATLLPANLTDVEGTLYFESIDAGGLQVLDKVDPASGAVVPVVYFTEDSRLGDFIAGITPVGHGRLLVETQNLDGTLNLLVSDGTARGTMPLRSHFAHSLTSGPAAAEIGSGFVFLADDGAGGLALWKSDGTVEGTVEVATLPGTSVGLAMASLLGFHAVFVVYGADGASTLWGTAGTTAGTVPLPSVQASFGGVVTLNRAYYFNRATGMMVITDGTAEGTTSLYAAKNIDAVTTAAGNVYFTTSDYPTTTRQLWETDFSARGMHLVGNYEIRAASTPLEFLTAPPDRILVGGGAFVFFSAWDPDHGLELWRSDGTSGGTFPLADILPGPEGSDPIHIAPVFDRVAFAAHDATGANELFLTRRFAAGVDRISAVSFPRPRTYDSVDLTNALAQTPVTIGSTTYFIARDPDHGWALWKTDGTTAGTVLVKDFTPGPGDTGDSLLMTGFGGGLVLVVPGKDGRDILWTSDGTASGTKLLAPGLPTPLYTVPVVRDGAVYFLTSSATKGRFALWKTDGTDGGTRQVVELTQRFPDPEVHQLFASSTQLFISGSNYGGKLELWASDGTADGTRQVASKSAVVAGGAPATFTTAGADLYFSTDDGVHGKELWVSDGTAAGTRIVVAFAPGAANSTPLTLASVGARLYFLADGGPGRVGLWTTDGTAAGTVFLRGFASIDPNNGGPSGLTPFGGRLAFIVRFGYGTDVGLYTSDGTPGGTVRVFGGGQMSVARLVNLGGTLYFAMVRSHPIVPGPEVFGADVLLYQSDGTAAGTRERAYVGPHPWNDKLVTVAAYNNGDLLIFGDDGIHGTEPMRVGAPDQPPGDFDGDGKTNPAVFRPSTAEWFALGAGGGQSLGTFGATGLGDIPVPGDYDGLGHAELAVFRPSTAEWFVLGPGGGRSLGKFGAPGLGDIPVPGDYDGDGKTNLAVFRLSTAEWFVLGPNGGYRLTTFGAQNLKDIPAVGDFDGVGHSQPAVFRPSTAEWFALGPHGGYSLGKFGAPNLTDIPVPGDYDGVGHSELAVFRPSTAQWFVLGSGGGHLIADVSGGRFGAQNLFDVPTAGQAAVLKRLGTFRTIHTLSVPSKSGFEPLASPPVDAGDAVRVTRPRPRVDQRPAPSSRAGSSRIAPTIWFALATTLPKRQGGLASPATEGRPRRRNS